MRLRALSTVGFCAAIALALTTSLAGTANAGQSARPQAVKKGATVAAPTGDSGVAQCAANLAAPNGDGLTAQDFGSGFPGYKTWGAADFDLAKKCKLKKAYIYGQATVSGVFGTSANAYIVSGASPATGTVTGCTVTNSATVGSSGTIENWRINFGSCTLPAGHYWLVAQVVKDFSSSGQWFWNATDTRAYSAPEDQITFGPDWGQPVNCTSPAFDTNDTCLGLAYDYLFQVGKKKLKP